MRRDYDYVIKQYCADSNSANVGGYSQTGLLSIPMCTCPAFKYGKTRDGHGDKTCKHIKQALEEGCFWHELYSEEPVKETGVCPRCGGRTEYVKVAI